MRPTVKPIGRNSPAMRFRAEIEQAVADGFACEGMRLRLTLGDASLLKRDASLSVSDISFAAGICESSVFGSRKAVSSEVNWSGRSADATPAWAGRDAIPAEHRRDGAVR